MIIKQFFNIHKVPRFKFFVPNKLLVQQYFTLFFSTLTRGKKVLDFEKDFSKFLTSPDSLAVSSFRMGLFYTLQALNLKPGDEILLSPITIPDTVNVILVLGFQPIFVDITLHSHGINVSELPKKVTKRTKVVLATHLSGIPTDIIELEKFCELNQLVLIEDFSQNIGGKVEGTYLGTFGQIGICSLSRGKTLTAMSGGMVVTKDQALLDNIRKQSQSNIPPSKKTFYYYLNYNFKINIITSHLFFNLITYYVILFLAIFKKAKWLEIAPEKQNKFDIFYDNVPVLRTSLPKEFFSFFSDWQAQMATALLRSLEINNQKRRDLASILLKNCSEQVLSHVPRNLFKLDENTIYHFPINCSIVERPQLLRYLLNHGVDAAGYGLNLCTEEAVFKDHWCVLEIAPIVKHGAIFIPIHESFDDNKILNIAQALNSYYR